MFINDQSFQHVMYQLFFPQLKKIKVTQDLVLVLHKEDDLSHNFKQFTQQTTYNLKAALIATSQI